MFLRRTERKKNGKTHHYWNVVENKRLDDGRVVRRHALYLGEINSSQAAAWRKAIEVFDEDAGRARTLALFPEDRCETVAGDASVVQLRLFLSKIELQYGKAQRVWVMDRGVPTEAVLAEMRNSDPPVQYLVGTPKGRLNRLEKHLLDKPWQEAREGVKVKLLAEDGELYVFAQSFDRVSKERAMRRRQLKWLWKRLRQITTMELTREELLMKLGGARSKAPAAWRLVNVEIDKERPSFTFVLDRKKLLITRRREGRYLLRTNLTENDPAQLWQYYTQLVAVEEAFRNLKGDLAIRPVFHQDEKRIEAHIFIAFLAYCMQITLTRRLHALAPGLTARSALEKFAAVLMIDVHLPSPDGSEILLTRYTHPEPELQLLIDQLKLRLPPQPPPRITTAAVTQATRRSEDLLT